MRYPVGISPVVQLGWQIASQEAVAANKDAIGPVQMLCGLSKVKELLAIPDIVPRVLTEPQHAAALLEVQRVENGLKRAGIDFTALRRTLRHKAGKGDHRHTPGETIHRSEVLKALFDRALLLAQNEELHVAEMRHFVVAMLDDPHLVVTTTVAEQGVEPARLIGLLREGTDPTGATRPEDPAQMPVAGDRAHDATEAKPPRQARSGAPPAGSPTPYLDRFGRDLTALARNHALGPVVGRRPELLKVMQTLMRRTKCNPVLVGEPGVGKTSVVELLAQRIAAGEVDSRFAHTRLVELSISTLVAGANHAGDREKRFEAVLQEAKANPHITLFIDELHTMMKAGGVGGSIDPADIFKPALARGEIKCIGATTHDEYDRYIQADAALERRFARVVVDEPSIEEALEILEGIRSSLERHHGVRFSDDTLRAAVELSVRFDHEHRLPDKAVDLLDLAAARTRLPQLSALDLAADGPVQETLVVEPSMVAEVLSSKLALPLDLVRRDLGGDRLSGLETFLRQRVVGQEDAAVRIARRVELAHTRLRQRRGPLCIFLFLGSTGIGKTEMARSLATFLFGDERAMIRLDMSEYMEEHSTSRLIGAPPGYKGHGESGQLTGALRKQPYSVVLLDEIDKAHPRVFDLFLQLFDDGRLTDSKGHTADGRHAIFILTSNVPVDQHRPVGFALNTAGTEAPELEALKSHFRPEFLNRIDDKILFKPLSLDHIRTIVERSLAEITQRVLEDYRLNLRCDRNVVDWLAKKGHSQADGARYLFRAIDTLFEAPLTRELRNLQGHTEESLVVRVALDAVEFVWQAEIGVQRKSPTPPARNDDRA